MTANKQLEKATNDARQYLVTPLNLRDTQEAIEHVRALYFALTDEENGLIDHDDDCVVWGR